MKLLYLFLLTISLNTAGAQLSGEIIEKHLRVREPISYLIDGNKGGSLYFDIAVDKDGNVSTCDYDRLESTIKSIPIMVNAKNRILQELKFEPRSLGKEFYYGRVKMRSFISKDSN